MGDGAAIEANAAGYNICDNLFTQNSLGILANAGGTIGAVGHGNTFDSNNRLGTYGSQGIHVGAAVTGVNIDGNIFTNQNAIEGAPTPGAIVLEGARRSRTTILPVAFAIPPT